MSAACCSRCHVTDDSCSNSNRNGDGTGMVEERPELQQGYLLGSS